MNGSQFAIGSDRLPLDHTSTIYFVWISCLQLRFSTLNLVGCGFALSNVRNTTNFLILYIRPFYFTQCNSKKRFISECMPNFDAPAIELFNDEEIFWVWFTKWIKLVECQRKCVICLSVTRSLPPFRKLMTSSKWSFSKIDDDGFASKWSSVREALFFQCLCVSQPRKALSTSPCFAETNKLYHGENRACNRDGRGLGNWSSHFHSGRPRPVLVLHSISQR